jgi:excisionase family DNA binding protein
MTEPLFLTIPETAELLGVSHDLVYDMTADGTLACTTFGRRHMVPRLAIDMIIERALEGFDPQALVVRVAGARATGSPPLAGPAPHAQGAERLPAPTGRQRRNPTAKAAARRSA